MDYGKVLSRAWQITWRWKVLWILGFLASLGQGFGSTGNTGYTTDSSDWGTKIDFVPPELIAILVAVACLAILIGIALWVISVMARGGLIAGVQQVEDKGSTSFLQAWRVGRNRFWTLFGIAVLTAIPILILAAILVVLFIAGLVGTGITADSVQEPAAILGILGPTLLCSGTFCCGLIILGIVLSQIQIYAERAAILEGLGWIEAFKRGWEVLKNNLGPTIIFWLIFLVIGLIFGMLIVGGIVAVAAPFVAIFSNVEPGPWILVPVCFGGLLAILVGAIVGSIVQTFTSATWTLVYRELTSITAQPAAEPLVES